MRRTRTFVDLGGCRCQVALWAVNCVLGKGTGTVQRRAVEPGVAQYVESGWATSAYWGSLLTGFVRIYVRYKMHRLLVQWQSVIKTFDHSFSLVILQRQGRCVP